MMTFTITCNECDEKITLANNENTSIYPIKICGEAMSLYEANVYIECNCGNSITVWRKL